MRACGRLSEYAGSCRTVAARRSVRPFQRSLGHWWALQQQGVRATATAEVASGNMVRCMLPFAVADRWGDDYDDNVDTTNFANDGTLRNRQAGRRMTCHRTTRPVRLAMLTSTLRRTGQHGPHGMDGDGGLRPPARFEGWQRRTVLRRAGRTRSICRKRGADD